MASTIKKNQLSQMAMASMVNRKNNDEFDGLGSRRKTELTMSLKSGLLSSRGPKLTPNAFKNNDKKSKSSDTK